MTKKIKIDFNQAKKAISLSEKWFDLGNGLYAAKVDPESTKCFFKSSRAAGRAYVMLDTAARVITLTDKLNGLDSFNAVEAAAVKEAAGLVEAAKKETETTGEIKEAAQELQAEIINLYGVPVAFNGVSITTKEKESGKFFGPLDLEKAGKYAAQKTPISAIFYLQNVEPAEIEFTKLNNTAVIRDAAKNAFLLTESIKAVQKPVTAEKFRAAKKAIKAGQFDAVELAKLATKATNRNPRAKRGIKDGSAALLKRSKLLLKEFKEEHESKDENTRFLSLAAWLLVNLSLTARRLLKKAAPVVAEQPKKDMGFTAVTLDRKEIEQAPLSATKEKAVKALTAQKRPKSKSRARLEASRAAIKTLDKTAADFTAFCKQINAGRKFPYSERNCALLYDQSNGAATCVKGFQSWKAAGRVVKKGSKALVIEAPKMIKGTDKNGEPYEKLICTPVCVFDISQTEELVKKEA